MLTFHLDESTDVASRRPVHIDGLVNWLDARLPLQGRRVVDLGCGPGLYAERMARRGAKVKGIDFSASSITHATNAARGSRLDVDYQQADYLRDYLTGPADLVTLIYEDYCAIGPVHRRRLLDKVRNMLAPNGHFVFDLTSTGQFADFTVGFACGPNFMEGFWSADDYFGLKASFRYDADAISLDRYLIVGAHDQIDVFNWIQYFTPASVAAELAAAGFLCDAVLDIASGAPWRPGPTPFAVVAKPV